MTIYKKRGAVSPMSKKEILRRLSMMYPNPKAELDFSNPFETVIATILAAQCTDKQVNKVTPELFSKYPTPLELAQADEQDVYRIVKSCGFKSKAQKVIATSQMIMNEYGGEVPNEMSKLIRLPGVGRKTANVVLSNAFGIPAIAVDTHVFRVSNRLGLAQAKTVEETERQLQKAIPKKDWSDAHHWLIFHGRRVCHAQRPDCSNCLLLDQCAHRP